MAEYDEAKLTPEGEGKRLISQASKLGVYGARPLANKAGARDKGRFPLQPHVFLPVRGRIFLTSSIQ